MISIPDDDFAHTASLLVGNLSQMPDSNLPFKDLTQEEVWREYGICTKEYCGPSGTSLVRGNFFSATYLRQTRLEAKRREKEEGIPRHNLQARRVLDLPIDIVLEVFGHLHPVDLLTLVRTTKLLRGWILSRGSAEVWTLSFARHQDVPAVPEGLSPPRWAMILYGTPRCDTCEVYPAMVDFTYYDRMCERCLRVLSCSQEEKMSQLGGMELDCVRGTYKTKSMCYPSEYVWFEKFSSAHGRYRISDVKEFKAHLATHEANIRKGVPGAQSARTQYLRAMAETLNREYRITVQYSTWATNMWSAMVTAYEDMIRRIGLIWGKRLVAQGYDKSDVDLVLGHRSFVWILRNHCIFKPGKRGLEKCQGRLEQARQAEMQMRLELGKKSRGREITKYYEDVGLRDMPPSLWSVMPPSHTILSLELINRYVETEDSDALSPSNHPAVSQLIQQFLQRWLAYSETPVFWALATAGYDICETDVRPVINIASMSVFTCPYHPKDVLIGWESIARHIACVLDDTATWQPDGANLSFSVLGHEIISPLIASTGKHPCNVTISDLDEEDSVFECNDCPLIHVDGTTYSSYFFTWRQAVLHGADQDVGHRTFSPVVLEATRLGVLGRRKPFPNPLDYAWICNHCTEHQRGPAKRQSVLHHLGTKHGIKNPQPGMDVLYVGNWKAKPVLLPRQPSECHICLLCSPTLPKVYHVAGLMMHLALKHDTTSPVEGCHWEHPQLEAAPPP